MSSNARERLDPDTDIGYTIYNKQLRYQYHKELKLKRKRQMKNELVKVRTRTA